MVLFGVEEFFRFLFGVDFVNEVSTVVGRAVTLFDDFWIVGIFQKFIPFFTVIEDIGFGNRDVIFPAESCDVLFGFVGKLCIKRGDKSDMREFSRDLPEGLVCCCRNVADEYVDLFAFNLLDETIFVIFPMISNGFDFVRPAAKVGMVEKTKNVIEI
jgi:hypothetical protein